MPGVTGRESMCQVCPYRDSGLVQRALSRPPDYADKDREPGSSGGARAGKVGIIRGLAETRELSRPAYSGRI